MNCAVSGKELSRKTDDQTEAHKVAATEPTVQAVTYEDLKGSQSLPNTEHLGSETKLQHDSSHKPHSPEGDPTDGRDPYEWKSRWPPEARKQQYLEGGYVFLMLVAALALLFLTWRNILAGYLALEGTSAATFNKFSYYAFSGLLGGTVFGVKYLYRVVARGRWNEDRRLWRLLSPWLSLSLAFAIATLIEAGWVSVAGTGAAATPASKYLAIGFLIGYFSDFAVAKMHEIARVVFGTSRGDSDHHD